MIRRAASELLAVLVPPLCVACRTSSVSAESLICQRCLRALPWLSGRPQCLRCALPAHRKPSECPAREAAFTSAWTPFAYEGVARDIVSALKFRAALPAAGLIAAQLAANIPDNFLEHGPTVVPVPGHAGRGRRRGFDPVQLIASHFADRAGLPISRSCLRRLDRAKRQSGSSRSQRVRIDRMRVGLSGDSPSSVLLIDDVHTTGATLQSCAAALAEGGAMKVAVITYARTL